MSITGRTATVAETTGVQTLTGTLPSDRVAGDLCIVVFACDGTTGNFTGPGGSWTQFVAPLSNSSAVPSLIAAYWQFSPGSAPSGSTTSAAGRWTVVCQSYGGVDTSTPIDVTAVTTVGNGTSLVATGATTATNGALLLSGYMLDTSSRTINIPSGMTLVKSYTAGGGGRALGIAQELRATAGASGTRTWSMTAAAALDQAAFVTALRPSGVVAVTAISPPATSIPAPTVAGAAPVTAVAISTATTIPAPVVSAGNATVAATAISTATTIPPPGLDSTVLATAVTPPVAAVPAPTVAGAAHVTATAVSPPKVTIAAPSVSGAAHASPAAIATTTSVPAPASIVGGRTFPGAPLSVTVALYLGGAWTDVTAYTLGRSEAPITITRGLTGEGGSPESSRMTLELNNADGRFSPRNPTGPYYGQLSRNTPIKVDIAEGGAYLALAAAGDYITTPDSASLSITGDLDVRVDLYRSDWTVQGDVIGKYDLTGNQRSWFLILTNDGTGSYPTLYWSTDGTVGTVTSVFPSSYLPTGDAGRLAIRATLDVDNGAGGYTVTFYVADTIAGPWRQLGAPRMTTSGTTSLFDSTAPLVVGEAAGALAGAPAAGRYYSAQVRNGIGGSLVANPIFTERLALEAGFVDAQGNAWTLAGAAVLSQTHTRFVGEVSEWPQKWDVTGNHAWVPVTAAGVLRRLGQGRSPQQSTLRRAIPATAGLRAYWPMEDGKESLSIAPGMDGVAPMVLSYSSTFGAPKFAESTDFQASAPLPQIETARTDGTVPTYTATGFSSFRWLQFISSASLPVNNSAILRLYCSGSISRIDLGWRTGTTGSLIWQGYDTAGASIGFSSQYSFDLTDSHCRLSIELTDSGGDCQVTVAKLRTGGGSGTAVQATETFVGKTHGTITKVSFNWSYSLVDTVLGHAVVADTYTSLYDLADEANAFLGEAAGTRMARLATENGETFTIVGTPTGTAALGYQGRKTFYDLLKEAASSDGGVLYEARDALGLQYRTRASLQRQNPRLSLSYPSHQMLALEPTEDDRYTRNRVTVTREDGAAAVAELATGAMSTADVGIYSTSETLSLASDLDATRQAHWQLHLGTVNEARYPTLTVNLASTAFTVDQTLVQDVLALDIGDQLAVVDPPRWVPPDDISQIIVGYTEKLGQFKHEIAWVLAPASPYRVGIYGDSVSRYTSDGSTLNGAHDSTTTSLSVATASGPVWSHSDGDFDLMIGGERMTVTAIAGTSSPQTFTVTRSVNQVVKAHAGGEAVELFEPYYYGL